MLDVERIRKDFPILHQQVNGQRLVYLDSAATTQKPRQVIDALVRYYETSNANIHRGIHTLAQRATEQYEGTRAKVARFIGATDPEDIVFTRNTTESINLVAHAWGDRFLSEGDEIVISQMEHHSNIVPWQLLAARTGAKVRFAGLIPDGRLDLDSMRALIGQRTKLVSVVHMSNVLGTINPAADIAEMAHGAGALFMLDAAQSVPHLPFSAANSGADLVAFSAHKMLGPTGGGDMIATVREEGSTWAEVPHKFEAGTPNIADVIAFGAAIEYLEALCMENVRRHEVALTAFAMDTLQRIPGLTIHGPRDPEARGGVVSFEVAGIHPHDMATIADGHGVAIRAGHHCAQLVMRQLRVPATSRASFSVYNGEDDIPPLVEAIEHARKVFA
jgi:cysteine desulfurase/selenocysteine lyase